MEYYLNIAISTSLLIVSLLPSVYLRYLPFRPVLDARTRNHLLQGYAIIFFLEITISLALFYGGIIPFNFPTFKIMWLFFGYTPYFILNLILIRPYVAQHFFILGIQQILAGTLSTFAVAITLLIIDGDDFFRHFKLFSPSFPLSSPSSDRSSCGLPASVRIASGTTSPRCPSSSSFTSRTTPSVIKHLPSSTSFRALPFLPRAYLSLSRRGADSSTSSRRRRRPSAILPSCAV